MQAARGLRLSKLRASTPCRARFRNLCSAGKSVGVAIPLNAWTMRSSLLEWFLLLIIGRRHENFVRTLASPVEHALSFVLTMANSANINGTRTLSTTRDVVVQFFEWFGNLSIFCARWIWAAFAPPYELREFVRQFDELGSKSLPLVAIAGAATSIVLTLSPRESLIRFGAKSLLPAVVVFSIIKDSGPIITALVVSGRAAAGIDRKSTRL